MTPAKPTIPPPGAFLILEGGGAKGLAHVGALTALKQRDLAVYGVAGASAGAIMAALTAAGYKPDELYTPARDGQPPSGLFADLDWIDVLGKDTWQRFQSLRDGLGTMARAWGWFKPVGWLAGGLYTLWFVVTRWGFVYRAYKRQGLFATEGFRAQVITWLKAKIPTRNADRGPTFAELAALRRFAAREAAGAAHDVPVLKIVAVDVNARELVVYDEHHTPDTAIADAVCASIAIPVFFAPPTVRTEIVAKDGGRHSIDRKSVDGGLISNFPAWLFLEEAVNCPAYTEIIGITLAEEPAPPSDLSTPPGPLVSAFRYLVQIGTTALFGAQRLQNTRVDRLHEISIPTRIGTLGFDAGEDMKDATFASGYDTARTYLDRHLRANPMDVQKLLDEIAAILSEYSQVDKTALTVSLARPNNAGTHLIVVNGVNLDPEHVGARLGVHVTLAGQAFQMRQPGEFRRLPDTAPHFRIPAHVEEMLCRPVNPKTAGNNPAVAAAAPLGVLSISSSVAFVDALRKNDPDLIEALLNDVSDSLAELLETGQMTSTLDAAAEHGLT